MCLFFFNFLQRITTCNQNCKIGYQMLDLFLNHLGWPEENGWNSGRGTWLLVHSVSMNINTREHQNNNAKIAYFCSWSHLPVIRKNTTVDMQQWVNHDLLPDFDFYFIHSSVRCLSHLSAQRACCVSINNITEYCLDRLFYERHEITVVVICAI